MQEKEVHDLIQNEDFQKKLEAISTHALNCSQCQYLTRMANIANEAIEAHMKIEGI